MANDQLETIDTALLANTTGGAFDLSQISGYLQKGQQIIGQIMPIAQKVMGMFNSGGSGAAAGGSQ